MELNRNVYELLRIARGLSKSELADKMGVTPSMISQVETGRRKPADELRKKYAEALGVRPSTILYFEEERDTKNLSYEKMLLTILSKIVGQSITDAQI